MHAKTVTHAVHRTTLTSTSPKKDGGREFLTEVFDSIREARQVGQLVVQFGVGGSICSAIFEERELIPQSAIQFVENGDSSPVIPQP